MSDTPHCASCGASVSVQSAWHAQPTNLLGLLRYPVVINCPQCACQLRIDQSRSAIALAATFAICALAVAVAARTLRHHELMSAAVVGVLIVAFIAMRERIATRFARLVVREVDYGDGRSEPYDAAWRCTQCRSANPGTKLECWRCHSPRASALS